MIVRNNAQFRTKPQWYFTDDRMEDYLTTAIRKGGWDTEKIGTLAEAFAIAKCDMSCEYKPDGMFCSFSYACYYSAPSYRQGPG